MEEIILHTNESLIVYPGESIRPQGTEPLRVRFGSSDEIPTDPGNKKPLSELARDAIIALNLIPAENVGINAVFVSLWDGVTKIVIAEDVSNEDEHQIGALPKTTPLEISCLSADRQTALEICNAAANAAFHAIEMRERIPEFGILAITRNQSGIGNIPDRDDAFKAFRSFNIINTIS